MPTQGRGRSSTPRRPTGTCRATGPTRCRLATPEAVHPPTTPPTAARVEKMANCSTDVPSTSCPYSTMSPPPICDNRLSAPSVTASVRSRSWPQSQRKPSAISALNEGGDPSARTGGDRFVATIANTSPAESPNDTASNSTGSTNPVARSSGGERGAEELVGHELGRVHPPVGPLEVLGIDDRRHEGLRAVVVEHLARAEQQGGHQHHDVEQPLGVDHLGDLVGRRQGNPRWRAHRARRPPSARRERRWR